MGLLSKLNKLTDICLKFGVLILAFTVALLPIAFLLGHQTLHQQTWRDSLADHSSRTTQIQEAKGRQFSNVYLKEGASDVKETLELADYICYTLQSQGEVVVRKNVHTKSAKKSKKGESSQIEGYKTVKTIHQNPPFKQLKLKLSKFIDFQSETLSQKHWVIVVSGGLDSHLVDQIENIDDKNPNYKFIIVSPNPIKHKIFDSTSSQSIDKQVEEETPSSHEPQVANQDQSVQGDQVQQEQGKKEKIEKKGKKNKKTKVKKVKVQAEQAKQKEKEVEL